MLSEPIAVVAKVATAFEALGLRYVVGGSIASSLYGIPRATNDADVVAELRDEHVDPLCAALSGEFYIDADMVRDAIARRASFNVVHLPTMFKVDVFIQRGDAWSREQMTRGRSETVEDRSIRFATPEDTVLHKLVWYRIGGEQSDRQWGDVLGVLKIQAGRLDDAYLDRWAPLLDVADLLERARQRR
jgi:hypothetical protein